MTITLNNSYLSNPITVPQGGSGLATTTANGILAGGTTTTGAFQNAGTGTAGQVYVGASGALGTWTNQNALGAWVLLGTQTASSSATISFTGLTTSYLVYKISIWNVTPGTASSQFQMLVSSNNGSSYDNAAGNYGYVFGRVPDTGTATAAFGASASTTAIQILNGMPTATSANNIDIFMIDPGNSYADNGIFWFGKYSGSSQEVVFGEGTRFATQINNAVQFSMSAGNIATGTFEIYGLQI